MKVAFCTLGCKVNQYETNAMSQKFIEAGYDVCEFENIADIYVINTCSVTNMADRKSRQMIHKVKEFNSKSVLIVTGCYAQVNKDELIKMPDIDIVIGNNDKKNIVEIAEKYLKDNNKIVAVKEINEEKEFSDFGSTTYTEKTRAVVKIQDGCNNFCTYCIIPYTKGRIRSRNMESILDEIKQNVKTGIKEIVITGIHIASYGKDFANGICLIDLLEKINDINGIERIRLGSLEPKIITEDFIIRLKKLNKICNHFHLSLQSGCDETLKRMNRKYTTTEFLKIAEDLRKNFKDVALTTDIIVGFPGETEQEFEETYKFLQKVNFTKTHIFKYSQRQGTVAAKMPNQINTKIKAERSKKLIELSNKNEENFLEKFIGKSVEVLFETEKDGISKGHTTNYMVVNVKQTELKDEIRKVQITSREQLELYGNVTQV